MMASEYYVVYLLVNAFVEVILCYAYCRLLDMRSNKVFVAVSLAGLVVGYNLMYTGAPSILRILTVTLPIGIIFPIVWSKGKLGERILWMTLLIVVVGVGEITGTIYFQVQTGLVHFNTITPENARYVLSTYVIILLVTLHGLVALIYIHDHRPHTVEDLSTGMFLVLLIWSVVLYLFVLNRWGSYDAYSSSFTPPAIAIIGCLVNAMLALIAVSVSHAEAVTRRDRTDATVLTRQIKHVRAEILEASKRTTMLRKLRHDLANQIDVVLHLARQGHPKEADQHLANLQCLTTELSGGAHESER